MNLRCIAFGHVEGWKMYGVDNLVVSRCARCGNVYVIKTGIRPAVP